MAVRVPVWRFPLVSMVGRRACRTRASAMKPERQTRRAASICAARRPLREPRLTVGARVAARAGLRNSSAGTRRLPGRSASADEVHSVSKSARTDSTVSPTRSTGGCPSSAYPMAYFMTSARDLVPWSRRSSIHASKAPGTAAASGPVPGTRSKPSPL